MSNIWLILSHAFNMDGRAASQTITDKIPHLLAKGVQPIVLSAVTGQQDRFVEHHQLLPFSPASLRFDLRFLLRRRLQSKLAYRLAIGLVTFLLLPFYALEKVLIRLEPQWSWFIPAYLKGASIIRHRRPAVLYSTGGANSAHLAGYLLAERFGLPWIAEIHDPMVPTAGPSGMAQRFAGWLEARICERADIAFWFVEPALERARRRHPNLGNRGRVLVPGADKPTFGKAVYERGSELVIGHFGSLSPTRHLKQFLLALEALTASRPDLCNLIRLEIYGGRLDRISQEAVARFAYPEMIRQFGRLEQDPITGESGRDRVLRRMRMADCLLLLHGTDSFCEEYIPSKLYEYLWTERPILGLVWRNAHLEGILREQGHWAVPADSPDRIVEALRELVLRWERRELGDSGKPSPYTVAAAVEQLCEWVDALPRRDKPRLDSMAQRI